MVMKGEKSWTQRDYEAAYVWMRRGVSFEWLARHDSSVSLEAVKAADYSYQAKEYWVSGWLNDRRQSRFFQIKWRVLTGSEEIPF